MAPEHAHSPPFFPAARPSWLTHSMPPRVGFECAHAAQPGLPVEALVPIPNGGSRPHRRSAARRPLPRPAAHTRRGRLPPHRPMYGQIEQGDEGRALLTLDRTSGRARTGRLAVHNDVHAADVLQTFNGLLCSSSVLVRMTPVEKVRLCTVRFNRELEPGADWKRGPGRLAVRPPVRCAVCRGGARPRPPRRQQRLPGAIAFPAGARVQRPLGPGKPSSR